MNLMYQKKQAKETSSLQTDWLVAERIRGAEETDSWSEIKFSLGAQTTLSNTWVYLSRFEHTKGTEGSREWMALRQRVVTVTVFHCKMLRNCWKYLLSLWPFPLIICCNQYLKKSFLIHKWHMYKLFLTPASFFVIYYFLSGKYDKAIYISCGRHIPVPGSLLLPQKVSKHIRDHGWVKASNTVPMLQKEN